MASEAEGKEPANYDDTPTGWAERWAVEFAAAKKEIAKYHQQGDKVVKRYIDEREGGEDETRLNLFHADVEMDRSLLLGKEARVSVGRRFADAKDDVARVAAELLERTLNSDLERDDDSFRDALRLAVLDRLLPGGAMLWLRLVQEHETLEAIPAIPPGPDGKGGADAVPEGKKLVWEDVESDYVPWKDALWSPCRVYSEMRWMARKASMGRAALEERFGAEVVRDLPLNSPGADKDDPEAAKHPWARADVWEIWSKEHKRVFWYVEGYPKTLDIQPDPYGLETFWPFPRPWFANVTTTKFMPRADFVLAQDLYNEIDRVSTRIDRLQRALKAVFVYDKKNTEVGSLMEERTDLTGIPAENFAEILAAGGVQAFFQFLPLTDIANALLALRDYRRELIDLLYQVRGKSDLMRGQQTENGTPGEAQAKMAYGAARQGSTAGELARFASDAQRIRAELICKKFQPQSILERANASAMVEDQRFMEGAIALLKGQFSALRIEIKSEALAYADFAQMRADRMEVLDSIGKYIAVAGPLMQEKPEAGPFLLEMLQHSLAGLKDGAGFEASLDHAVQAMQQQAQQPQAQPEDPKVTAEKMKAQNQQAKAASDLQLKQTDASLKAQQTQLESAADDQRESAQAQNEMKARAFEFQLDRQAAEDDARLKIQVEKAKPKPVVKPNPGGGK